MRKLITTAAAATALLFFQACYFVPVERTHRRGRTIAVGVATDAYYDDGYCMDPPGYVLRCGDILDSYNYYIGTCCDMVQHNQDYRCDYYDQSYHKTYCQYIDSCEWYQDGRGFCM